MNEYFIFSDASFDPKSKRGITAFLILSASQWKKNAEDCNFDIQTKQIDGENIARLEFISAITAFEEWKIHFQTVETSVQITLITDCKALENLLKRRKRLERTQFISQSKGEVLANADLYQEFLTLFDELQPEILWVKGHSPAKNRSDFQKVFSSVDKAARNLLRKS